jgi:hypothetical protein
LNCGKYNYHLIVLIDQEEKEGEEKQEREEKQK